MANSYRVDFGGESIHGSYGKIGYYLSGAISIEVSAAIAWDGKGELLPAKEVRARAIIVAKAILKETNLPVCGLYESISPITFE